jgi:hypothetical protein
LFFTNAAGFERHDKPVGLADLQFGSVQKACGRGDGRAVLFSDSPNA